ncbi:MAG: hypothetical protein EXQ97_01750 [Alphaproteobacteria bacterium]|nr:hypothetical protein [Alphaproteobacteria bacterium]
MMGTKAQDQGHATIFKQLLSEKLGIDPADARYIDGNTDVVNVGMGTMGSRSTVIGGTAITVADDKVIVKARKLTAHMMEAGEADIEFSDGTLTGAGTDRALPLKEVVRTSFLPERLPSGMEPGLYETVSFSPDAATCPNCCHACEVEIDPGTGVTSILGWWVVDDVGVVINPTMVKGQIHGGIAQGVGQILG